MLSFKPLRNQTSRKTLMKRNTKQRGKYMKIKISSFNQIKVLISKASLVFKYFQGNKSSQKPMYQYVWREKRSRQWRYVNLRNTCCLKPSHFMMSSKSPCRKETETILKKPVRHAEELEISLWQARVCSVQTKCDLHIL